MIKHVKDCLIKKDSKLPKGVLELSGMSTPHIRNLLNNIVSMKGARYLEVGLWRGATFISALYGNAPEYACGVDNWSENSRPVFDMNISKYIATEFKVLSGDAFEVKPEKNINIFLYDASHSFSNQYKALIYYYKYLADEFIYLVDDYNLPHVQKATEKSIRRLGLKVKFSKRLGKAEYREHAPAYDWWLGFYIAVLKK